jgi:hypothetical protein
MNWDECGRKEAWPILKSVLVWDWHGGNKKSVNIR